MPKSNSINWQIESIRCTVFLIGQLNPNDIETWLEKISGNTLSQVTKTPSSFIGVSRSQAGFLRTSWQANRLDVILSPEESRSTQSIAPITDAHSLFDSFVNRVPEICESVLVSRIALGLVLTNQISNQREGIELLKAEIVSMDIPQSAQDFLFRVNIPCESHTTKGISLNRLTTWSIIYPQIIEVKPLQDGGQEQRIVSEGPLVLKLELDINTDKEASLDINLGQSVTLFTEFQEIALKISSEGESIMLD